LWLHSLKVAQLLRSAACLHTNQSRSYLNHLVQKHCDSTQENFIPHGFLYLASLSVTLPLLRQLVTRLSPRRPRFNPRPTHVAYVVDSVALGQVFPWVLHPSLVGAIPPTFYAHLFMYHPHCITLATDSTVQ